MDNNHEKEFQIMNNGLDALEWLARHPDKSVRIAAFDLRAYIKQLDTKINDWVNLTLKGEATREKVMLELILNSDKLSKPSSSSG